MLDIGQTLKTLTWMNIVMDNLLIDLKTTSTSDIVDEIIDNYFTALFVGKIEGEESIDKTEISILTIIKELEDDAKFIKLIMSLVRKDDQYAKDYYWLKARKLCAELVQQAKEDYYYE
jgi:hypothetical protein